MGSNLEPYDIMVDDIDEVIFSLRDTGMSWEEIRVKANDHLPRRAWSTMERFVNHEIERGKKG